MHIADCMSRNPLDDTTTGRKNYTAPSGIWLDDHVTPFSCPMESAMLNIKEPIRWELNCNQVVPHKLHGYEVGPRTMSVECSLAPVGTDMLNWNNDESSDESDDERFAILMFVRLRANL